MATTSTTNKTQTKLHDNIAVLTAGSDVVATKTLPTGFGATIGVLITNTGTPTTAGQCIIKTANDTGAYNKVTIATLTGSLANAAAQDFPPVVIPKEVQYVEVTIGRNVGSTVTFRVDISEVVSIATA